MSTNCKIAINYKYIVNCPVSPYLIFLVLFVTIIDLAVFFLFGDFCDNKDVRDIKKLLSNMRKFAEGTFFAKSFALKEFANFIGGFL